MQIELANKIRNGRAVGNEYVVTRRDETPSKSGILARFNTREEAAAWITGAKRMTADRRKAGEYGVRAGYALRTITRAVDIATRQGSVCLPESELNWLAGQAWANARLAAHHARLAEPGLAR